MQVRHVVKGALIGTLVIFLWNSTEWFNPLMKSPYHQVKDPIQYNSFMQEQMPEDGIYAWHANFANESGITEAGSVFYFTAKAEESYYNPEKFITIELVTQFCIWLLISYLLLGMGKKTYWRQMRLIMTLGLITIFSFLVPMWNWWAFSSEFVLLRGFQMLFGWFLAGTVLYFTLWPKRTTNAENSSKPYSFRHDL